MKQFSKEQAIKFYNSEVWKDMSDKDLVKFQLFQDRLCMPFEVFHATMSKILKRDIYTHEFGLNRDGLTKEYLGEKEPPTFEEIMNLIPVEKIILIEI